jgi:ribokinase
MKYSKITIIGSIHMDMVTVSEQMPNKGETVFGTHFQTNPGGKGANQAIAAARLGGNVNLIGCVGNDAFGRELVDYFNTQNINVANVKFVEGQTGTATIIVSESDNSIIVVQGAGKHVTPDFIETKREVIAATDILLLQLEIPLESVIKAVEIAKEYNVTVILNPTPVRKLPVDLLQQVDYLTPNEHEWELLKEDFMPAHIMSKLIVTKGDEGVSFFKNDVEHKIPAYPINVVDTTGAGDTFNGAFAVALSKGASLKVACQFGNAAAALSTTKMGAQSGMPTSKQVEEFMKSFNR